MSYKILADTFAVTRDSDHFVQLKTLKSPRTEDQVWIAFKIVGSSKFARSTIQNFIETIEEVFFDNLELETYERFEKTLKEINLIYKNLKQKRGTESVGKISAIIAVFSGNEMHLTQSNEAEAYLIRKGKLSLISEGLSAKSDDIFVNIASGELLPEDKIIFSTSRLLRVVTQTQLVQVCMDGVAEALDGIREIVLGDTELSIGVTCVHMKAPSRGTAKVDLKHSAFLVKTKNLWDKACVWVGDKVGHKISLPKLGRKAGGGSGSGQKMDRNTILASILFVVLLLIISVSFLMDGNRDQALREEYRIRIEAMNQDLHVANTKGYANDKETANAILTKVEKEARDILESNYFREEVLVLLDKIQETRDSINNTKRVSEAKPYVDLSTKKENVESIGLLNLDGNFFSFEYNTLYEIILDQILEPKHIDDTEVVMGGTAMEDQGVLVFLTQSGRIIEYDNGEFRFASTDDEIWKPGTAIAAYGRYIYMLSPSTNQIYKYARLRSSYSSASEYNTDADVSDAISLAIDGNIYVLKKGGEIIKIFKSKQADFQLENMATDISQATKLFTTPELNNLYVLDPVNKRVVILEKEVGAGARYKGQIYFENIDNVKDFYIEKSEKTLYLLTGKQIYQLEI